MAEPVQLISAEQFQAFTELYTRNADRPTALRLLAEASSTIHCCDGHASTELCLTLNNPYELSYRHPGAEIRQDSSSHVFDALML